MTTDIMGRIPVIGNTIIRAMYARDSSLHIGKVTEVKDNSIKIDRYRKAAGDTYSRVTYYTNVLVQTEYLILDTIQL